MRHPERLECHLFTPHQQFFSRFVSSTIVRSDPDIPYVASRAVYMFFTHTPRQEFYFEFCVLTQRLIRSKHSLWGSPNNQMCFIYTKDFSCTILVFQPASDQIQTYAISLPSGQNAIYIHHNKKKSWSFFLLLWILLAFLNLLASFSRFLVFEYFFRIIFRFLDFFL